MTQLRETPFGVDDTGVLRVCYDLNVFYSAFYNERRGKKNTLSQRLLDAIQTGRCPLGPLQLVVSKSMTTHLAVNLETHDSVDNKAATDFSDALEAIARHGPERLDPLVFVGPTRFTSVVDPDEEDSHVLEALRLPSEFDASRARLAFPLHARRVRWMLGFGRFGHCPKCSG